MKMTPVRLEERDLIDLSIMSEIDFQATWIELNNRIIAYQKIYDTYRKNILDRIEDFKSNLNPEVIVWLFAKREVQLLINAWKVLNELLLDLRVNALPLPDEAFNNKALIEAGLTYQNIYGTREMTTGKGRYDIITDPEKSISFCLAKLTAPYASGDPGMDQDHVEDYLLRSRMTSTEDSVTTNYETCWMQSANNRYYEWESYQPVSTYCREDWFYAFKQTPTSDYTVARVISQEQFNGLRRAFGQMYLCITKNTRQDLHVGVGFREDEIEYITLKLKRAGEHETLVREDAYRSRVYYSTEYRAALKNSYQRYDILTKAYVNLPTIANQDALQTAMDTYGTVYVNRKVFVCENVCIDNIMDFIYDVLDWRHVDIDNVVCRACGHVGMIDNPSEMQLHWLSCPECGNQNAYAMKFPTIAYLDFIRPLFKYDPNFSWYDIYINNKSIHNELSPIKMWKGRFGHGGSGAWTQEIDDLMYKRSLRKSEWDKSAYDLAGDTCLLIDRYNLTNKIKADEILTLFTEKGQAKAMFQVGNIWACRHEIVRVLCTQLMKIHQKGILIK